MNALPRQLAHLTVADLADQLGPMPLARIRFSPPPGQATEEDVLEIHRREKRLCELSEGVLVEKTMGFRESNLAAALIEHLRGFVRPRKLGAVAGEAGMMRLAAGLVRIPDVSFVRWEQFPERRLPEEPIPDIHPDLAIEVLSPSNTDREMETKRRDYFAAGTRLVWEVDPVQRIVTIYTPDGAAERLSEDRTLVGDPVLPGFALSLAELFAELDAQG